MNLLNNNEACHSGLRAGISSVQDSNNFTEEKITSNEIRIVINKPQNEVFEYTLEPKNTPNWIDFIQHEEIDTEQINVGTKYINDFGKMEVTDYEKNVFFELTGEDKKYQCSYSFRKVDEEQTEIIYFECMLDNSELDEPFDKKYFENLKELIEN